jgi:hypothetical protein
MKYIDGIKETGGNKAVNLIIRVFKTGKHIPITYYKPLIICDDHLSKTTFLPELEDFDNLEWIDGQPYELIIIGGNR